MAGPIANYPFHTPCLEQCDAIAVKWNDDFDGVDIDNPPEKIEIEYQQAVNKLDVLCLEILSEKIKFKKIVNAYNTTLRNTTSVRHDYWKAVSVLEDSSQIETRHLGFVKKKT